jgi:hypothetical protein
MAALMTEKDLMIADRAFRSLREEAYILTGWSKHKAKELTQWQQQETKEISNQRGSLERFIGDLVDR